LPFEDDLYRELVRLRHGRGVQEPRAAERLGPLLRELSGVAPGDTDAVARQRVRAVLAELATDLPDDLRSAAELALALGERPPIRLNQRTQTLAEQIHSSERTARRRMDEATRLLARAALGRADPATPADAGSGWRVRSLTALLRLDTDTPELYETRTVQAERTIDEVTVRLDLPAWDGRDGPALPLRIDAVYGARVTGVDGGPDYRHYRVAVRPPRPLRPDEQLEFCLHYRVPPGQPIRDHCAIVPLEECDNGRVRVRFDPAAPPASVWRLAAVAPRQLDRATTVPGQDRLDPDGAGEVAVAFHGLRQGHGYGVAWQRSR